MYLKEEKHANLATRRINQPQTTWAEDHVGRSAFPYERH